MTELRAELGEPDRSFGFRRMSTLMYTDTGLEIIIATLADGQIEDDSVVISIGTRSNSYRTYPTRYTP